MLRVVGSAGEVQQYETDNSGTINFSDLNTGLLGIPSGNSMASFLLGYVDNANATFYTVFGVRARRDAWAAFAGDNWK